MALKTITVFCGSSLGNDPRFEESAKGSVLCQTFLLRLFYKKCGSLFSVRIASS